MTDAKARPDSILVTVTGADHPGITAALAEVVGKAGVVLLDIEQVVVQGQLVLTLVLDSTSPGMQEQSILKDLLFTAKAMGLDLSFKPLSRESQTKPGERIRFAVTAISDQLVANGVHIISKILAEHDANIETIKQLSASSFGCIEIVMSLPATTNAKVLRRQLALAAANHGIDLALQRESLLRRTKRLVVMDMDSTLIQVEVIDEIARIAGVEQKVSAITERAMKGELDFAASLKERVALLEGLHFEKLHKIAESLPLTEGAEHMLSVLKTLGYKTAVISGGFEFAVQSLKEKLALDYVYANTLEVVDGRLTGRVIEPIVTPQRKADLLDTIAQGEGLTRHQTIAIGDGANDMAMLERAGLGIAFHAKPKLKAAADTTVSRGGLDRVLYLLGLHERDAAEIDPR